MPLYVTGPIVLFYLFVVLHCIKQPRSCDIMSIFNSDPSCSGCGRASCTWVFSGTLDGSPCWARCRCTGWFRTTCSRTRWTWGTLPVECYSYDTRRTSGWYRRTVARTPRNRRTPRSAFVPLVVLGCSVWRLPGLPACWCTPWISIAPGLCKHSSAHAWRASVSVWFPATQSAIRTWDPAQTLLCWTPSSAPAWWPPCSRMRLGCWSRRKPLRPGLVFWIDRFR